jgi:hypothetical protein
MQSGLHMIDTIVGGALALTLLGLPLAIIGLFVQSILTQMSALRAERNEIVAPADNRPPLKRARKNPNGMLFHPPNTSPDGRRVVFDAPTGARHPGETAFVSSDRGPEQPEIPRSAPAIVAAASVQGDGGAPGGCSPDYGS